jgi:hypothetical protein
MNDVVLPRCLKVTLFSPLLDNDGEAFDEEVWRWWQREMLRLGDYTAPGIVDGVYRGHTDHNRMIVMVVEESRLETIREFLVEARERFRQEAMYFEYHDVSFELVTERPG